MDVTSRIEHKLKLTAPSFRELCDALVKRAPENPYVVSLNHWSNEGWVAIVIWHEDLSHTELVS